MKSIIAIILFSIVSLAQAAPSCTGSGTITNMGNRGAFFDINGGMRHGGITMIYPTRQQTVFENGADTFKVGYTVEFIAQRADNGMCKPTGRFTVIKKD